MKITITLSEDELRQAAIDYVAGRKVSYPGMRVVPISATFETHAGDREGMTETLASVECNVSEKVSG